MENNTNRSRVTIAIPFYNADKFLEKAIDSVIKQTYTEWKLLLINDGSTDKSLEIAKRFESADNRIKVFSDGENKNLAFRLNQIPELADTEFLVRMDADDIMHPKKIEKQMAVMLENSGIDVLGTNAYSIDENDKVFGIRFSETRKDYVVDVNGFVHPTIMAKTEWFRNNKYDDKALRIEDTELWYRTSNHFTFKMVTEPLFFYREIGSGYYKKYFLANNAKKYILKKYGKEKFWRNFFMGNTIRGIIYWLFNIIGSEDYLVTKRNQTILKNKKDYKNFYTDD
jgi:glycosyltransferase involved in cell wall biosynthesis